MGLGFTEKGKHLKLAEAETLFELGNGYSLKDVKSAHRRLAKRHHPDVNDNSDESKKLMQQINEAYDLLVENLERTQEDEPYEVRRAEQSPQPEARHDEAHNDWERWYREVEEERRREAERRRQARRAEEREKVYRKACENAQKAKTAEEFAKVAALFQYVGRYRDAETQHAHYEAIAEEKRVAEETEAAERLAQATPPNVVSIVSAIAASVAYLLLMLALMLGNAGPIIPDRVPEYILGLSIFVIPALIVPAFGIYTLVDSRETGLDDTSARFVGGFAIGLAVIGAIFASYNATSVPDSLLEDPALARSTFLWGHAAFTIAIAQLVGGVSCMLGTSRKLARIVKIGIACASFAVLIAAVGIWATA